MANLFGTPRQMAAGRTVSVAYLPSTVCDPQLAPPTEEEVAVVHADGTPVHTAEDYPIVQYPE